MPIPVVFVVLFTFLITTFSLTFKLWGKDVSTVTTVFDTDADDMNLRFLLNEWSADVIEVSLASELLW